MKYMNKTLMLMAAALMAFSACDKWTETEPVNVVYETLESKNPDLYAKYLQSLRDYHASAHQVLIAKFDNKAEAPSGRADHISCLPDSVDFVVLNNPSLLNDQIRKEMTEIREQKGVKTLMNVSWDAMLAEYNAILADETEAKNAEWDALSDEEKEARKEAFDADPRGKDTQERFIAWMQDRVAKELEIPAAEGFDGINVIFNAANPNSYNEEKKADMTARQLAFFSKVDDFVAAHPENLVFFEGTPKYILAENKIIAAARYIIVPALSETNGTGLSFAVNKTLGGNVPSDRVIIGVTAVDITDPTNTNGIFSDGSAIVGAANWAVDPAVGYVKAGVCVDHAQFDYYDITNVYSQINKAISIMNPSPVK